MGRTANQSALSVIAPERGVNPAPLAMSAYAVHCHLCGSIFVISNRCSNCNHEQVSLGTRPFLT